MFIQLVAITCITACLVAIFFAWKAYKETGKIKPKSKEDEEEELRF